MEKLLKKLSIITGIISSSASTTLMSMSISNKSVVLMLLEESKNRLYSILNQNDNLMTKELTSFNLKSIDKKVNNNDLKTLQILNNQCEISLKKMNTEEFDLLMNSMVVLSNYLLFDASCNSAKILLKKSEICLFPDLTRSEINDIIYFSEEIDTIQEELLKLTDDIYRLELSQRKYTESLIDLSEKKDELIKHFISYYDEYFVNSDNSITENILNKKSKKTNSKKKPEEEEKSKKIETERKFSQVYEYAVPIHNRFAILGRRILKN
jgi:hypothetical protein